MASLTLRQLPSLAPFSRLQLESHGCSQYSVALWHGASWHRLVDDAGRPLLYHSQLAAKKPLRGLGIGASQLLLHSAYDEMIGLASASDPADPIPIANPDQDLS